MAILDNAYYMDNCKKIIETREYTQKKLRELGFSLTESKANFIFAKSDKIGGKELYSALKSRGILVRHFDKEKIKDYNRITVGTREEMDALISAITDILKEL
jgi:histidinol-phosphate aminotransferase